MPEALDSLLAGAATATDQDRFLYTLAVNEVLTNMVQHGGDGATMRIEIDAPADELSAQFWDTAAPAAIDWDSIPLPEDGAESGRLGARDLGAQRTPSHPFGRWQYMVVAAAHPG